MSTITQYNDLIQSKLITLKPAGFNPVNINPKLYDWQKVVVEWAVKQGRCAFFEDCGLGKTPQQLEWASQVHEHTNKPLLVL